MGRIYFALGGLVMVVAVLSSNVFAGSMDSFSDVEGKIRVEKTQSGELASIKVQPKDTTPVQIVIDEMTKDMTNYNGYAIIATGKYTTNKTFKVSSWFIQGGW